MLCGNKPDTKGILADHTEARHLSLAKTPSASILLDLRRDASILWGVAATPFQICRECPMLMWGAE
jgi:hypothetical protein